MSILKDMKKIRELYCLDLPNFVYFVRLSYNKKDGNNHLLAHGANKEFNRICWKVWREDIKPSVNNHIFSEFNEQNAIPIMSTILDKSESDKKIDDFVEESKIKLMDFADTAFLAKSVMERPVDIRNVSAICLSCIYLNQFDICIDVINSAKKNGVWPSLSIGRTIYSSIEDYVGTEWWLLSGRNA